MAEIRTVTTLRRMRDEVHKTVRKYKQCLDQASTDLTHLISAIAIFEAKGGDESLLAYANLHRLFRYGDSHSQFACVLQESRKPRILIPG
jgi:hypothetical protein